MLHGVQIYDLTVWCRVSGAVTWDNIKFKKILNDEGNEILPILQEHEQNEIINRLKELDRGGKVERQLQSRGKNVRRAS